MPSRLMYTNRVAGGVLTVSSEAGGFPRSSLQDEAPGLRWRSRLGWNIVAGWNDKLDFSDGSTRVATIPAGNYATGALLAAAIQTAMNAVSTTCVVSYGSSKFTISRTGTLSLLWQSGANAAASIGKCLGFVVSSNDTGSSSYLADAVSYKSREWLKVDLGSALAVQVGIVVEHNLGAGGTVTQEGNASDSWSSPAVSDVLTGDAVIRLAYRASSAQRWWRLVIDDVSTNPAGYTELGVWYAGPYDQPSVTWSQSFARTPVPLSRVVQGETGATWRDERPARWVYSMSWLEVPEADRAKLAAWVAAAPAGKPTFLAFDPTNEPLNVVYGFFRDGVPQQMSGSLYWTMPFTFEQALP